MESSRDAPARAPRSRTVPPVRRIAMRLGLVLAVFVAGALAAEAGYRAWKGSQGASFDSARARRTIERSASEAADLVPRVRTGGTSALDLGQRMAPVLHPYAGYDQIGGIEQLASDLPRVAAGPDPDELEIVIVGGSVSTIFAQFGAPLVVERLALDPRFAGKRFRISCYGRGGHKQPQQLGMVNWILGLGFRPALVLNLDGFNEVALSNDNARRGVHPGHPSSGHWASLAAGGVADRGALDHASRARAHQEAVAQRAHRALALGFDKSFLLTQYTLRAMNRELAAARASFGAYADRVRELSDALVLRGPGFDAAPRAAVEASVRLWAESSRSLRGLCEVRGISYLHVLQPNLLDVGDRAPSSQELEAHARGDTWAEGVQLGYPRLRAVGRELALEGERFVDASGVFDARADEAELYDDRCHFNAEGNRVLAEFLVAPTAEALAARR